MRNEKKLAVVMVLAGAMCASRGALAQSDRASGSAGDGQSASDAEGGCALDGKREAAALQVLLKSVERQITGAAKAMPADKYGFQPTEGEFKGVRTFAQQVKHLAATNHMLAAAALGEAPHADAGDEAGPETVRTKAEILGYLEDSFAQLNKGIDAIGNCGVGVKSSPISPLKKSVVTRESLLVEAMIHSFDHYGQMVEYLRMNGVVPPASLP